MKDNKMNKTARLLFSLLFALMLSSVGISPEIPVLQAAQKQEEMEQELPTGGVDEIKVYQVDAAAAEHVPSYENQLSFFSRTTSVFEAGTGDYGYNSLADNQKSLYMSLEISLRNFENTENAEFTNVWGIYYVPFKVSCNTAEINDEEIKQMFIAFEADHPGVFWMRNFLISSSTWADGMSECFIMPVVTDEYENDLAGIKETYAKIEDGVVGYLDAVAGIDDTYEKVRIVYDKLINEVKYAYDSSGEPEYADWAHSIVGVFDGVHASVVCEGYAKTFSFLMNILDIPSVYISGIVASTSSNPRHAWNAVSFDGGNTYYYVDATWDDKGEENELQNRYEYFAMPKSGFEESHMAHTPLEGGYEWLYELPTLGDDMDFTYYARYAALATKDMVRDPESAKEFLMAASALAPGKFCMVLAPDDFRTRRNMKDALDGISYLDTAYSRYGIMDVELYVMSAENYLPAVPAKTFSLSDQAVTIDMDETTTQGIKVCSVTEGSDDYIRCYSSNEKVATVEKACIRAKNGESIHIVAKEGGTAVIYAKSAKGRAVVACTVLVKPASIPIPTATPAPVSPPSKYGLESPRTDSDRVTTWDCVYFGNYWQNDTNGDGVADEEDEKEPVKWRVLSVDGDDVFLMADQTLDVQPYHNVEGKVTWETSALRAWLNDTFLSAAFSGDEQSAIQTTRVVNNDGYRTNDEKDTDDKLYLLSLDEVTDTSYGFISSSISTAAREQLNTQYAERKCQNAEDFGKVDHWWLRSMGEESDYKYIDYTSIVYEDGMVYWRGCASDINGGVRPVLHLNLSSTSAWTLAGTVSSDGTVTTPNTQPTPTIVPTLNPAASPAVSPIPTAATTGEPSLNIADPRTDQEGVTTWDCVYFGNYWKSDTDGNGKADQNDLKEPIKWRVLAVDGDDVFLLADQNLDVQTYSGDSWEDSGVRSWLNGTFLQNAFNSCEMSAIKNTIVANEGNQKYHISGGKDTEDKVYLLSISEATNASYGFASRMGNTNARKSANTEYVANGGSVDSKYMKDAGDCDWWWLRSPGFSCRMASDVDENGRVYEKGMNVGVRNRAVRPALHLNLSSADVCSPAGTVSSDGTVIEIAPTPTVKPSVTPAATVMPTKIPTFAPVATETPTAMPTVKPSPIEKPSSTPSDLPLEKDLENPKVNLDGVATWDCVYFGNYWQEDTNGDGKADKNDEKTPIKWRVLSVDGDDAYLLADTILDVKEYNNILHVTGVTWENCTMRSWLNGYGAEMNKSGKDYSDDNFLNNAFSKDEQSAIQMTNVVNNEDLRNDAGKGNDTLDKVYLLSNDEVINPIYGFSTDYSKEDKGRRAKNSVYAKGEGAYTGMGEYTGNGWWQLRTPGGWNNGSACVTDTGLVRTGGDLVVEGYRRCADAVRPVLHLNLSVKGWSYAGTVSSDETAGGTVTPSPVPMATTTPTATPVFTPVAVPSNPPFQKSLSNPEISDGITTWDCIYFGNYWQEDTNEDGKADTNDAKQPIKWRVLSVDGDDVFLLADKNLDAQEYNDANTSITWETCTMRSWLNGYGSAMNQEGKDYSGSGFINNAFSGEEQSAIQNTNIVNDAYGTVGGNDTSDKVYLLSIDEVTNSEYGFATDDRQCDEGRRAKNTAYAKVQGVDNDTSEEHSENGRWWLRTLGGVYNRSARYVNYAGDVNFCYYGYYNSNYHQAVRPALRLNLLSASGWSYAGTVSSDGTETEAVIPSPTPLPATATPKPTNTPDISPTEHPGITPTIQPLPTVEPTPTPKPTEQPTFSPGDTSSPTESPISPPEDTSSPTETPKPTSSPEPSKQPPQTTFVPSVTAAPNPNEIGVPDNHIEKRLKKGDSFVAGNIKYRVAKLKGKKGEVAVAGVKSKKSKSFVIPHKVKKEGVTFTVTSIQKNAFKGCKKAKTLTIKSTSIRGITKKALAGLVKQIRIRIPKSKTAQYWSVLRKLGYSKVNW